MNFSILNYVRCPVCEGNLSDPNHPYHLPDPTVFPDFSLPRVIKESIEWVVVGDARYCKRCKHDHYPRVPKPNYRGVAPQWSFCEDMSCTCRSLYKDHV